MKKTNKKRFFGFITGAALLIGVGLAVGWLVFGRSSNTAKYSLLDPTVNNPKIKQSLINFDPLRQEIKNYLTKLNLAHSFYFEYLTNGISIRDGADSVSIAASLMKTPVVMDLYKLAEAGKINLDDTVKIEQQDVSSDSDFGNPSGLQSGQTISLRNAAKLTLHNSDNTAVNIIKRVVIPLTTDESDSIQSLDISYSLSTDGSNDKVLSISARSYSSIIKCLYYSCFLEPKDSQELLSYLIGSVGHGRLMSGVGQDIKVAHKVGSGIRAQSDCGIIYAPGKPYVLCLMFWNYPSESGDETNPYFKKVSQLAWNYVNKNRN